MSRHKATAEQLVRAARAAAIAKYGAITADSLRATAILTSECGEVAEAALEATKFNADHIKTSAHLLTELAQVAATAQLMIETILGGGPWDEVLAAAEREIRDGR